MSIMIAGFKAEYIFFREKVNPAIKKKPQTIGHCSMQDMNKNPYDC